MELFGPQRIGWNSETNVNLIQINLYYFYDLFRELLDKCDNYGS